MTERFCASCGEEMIPGTPGVFDHGTGDGRHVACSPTPRAKAAGGMGWAEKHTATATELMEHAATCLAQGDLVGAAGYLEDAAVEVRMADRWQSKE